MLFDWHVIRWGSKMDVKKTCVQKRSGIVLRI
jgi:hypothetical protein